MSRYNVFYLRVKGTEDNCDEFFSVLAQYGGHTDDLYYVLENGSDDDYAAEIRGALRGDVKFYMIDSPPKEHSLAGLSKSLGLEIEVFASDPGDGEFEYYYYVNGELVDCRNLPSSFPAFMLDEMELSEEDRKKYDLDKSDNYTLKDEYLPDAEWDESGEEMICNFKIEMDESEEDDDDDFEYMDEFEDEYGCEYSVSDKMESLAKMGITPDENGFAISYNSDNNTATLFEYFGTEKKVTVPNGITETEMGCFSNNEVIEEVVFPESFKKLGGGCFNNCPNLKKVVFPARTEDFYLDAFYGSDNVVIYAPPDSETKKFANIKRIPFQAI